MYTIAQITDTHIPPIGELLRGEVDSRSRLLNVIADVKKYEPDMIVFSGDMAAEDGTEEIYYWIRKSIENIETTICFIPGNHDDVNLMKRYLDIKQMVFEGELFYFKDIERFRIVFLDSSSEKLSSCQLNWLKEKHDDTKKFLILFVHHPLDLCGCKHMDRKYPLRNISEVRKVIEECDRIKYIFSGHYHIEKSKKIHQATQYLTPSTAFQILSEPEKCVADYKNYGWRFIELDECKMNTEVKYLK